jgi:hypothetical protein
MRQQLKNSIAILLIGLLLYNSLGYLWVSRAIRLIHRQQVFVSLSSTPESALTVLTFPKEKEHLLFVHGKKEIKYKGQMYDVVRYKDNGRNITYYCFHDRKETGMIRYTNKLNQEQGTQSPLPKAARMLLDSIIKTALLHDYSVPYNLSFITTIQTRVLVTYQDPDMPVPALPPQVSC